MKKNCVIVNKELREPESSRPRLRAPRRRWLLWPTPVWTTAPLCNTFQSEPEEDPQVAYTSGREPDRGFVAFLSREKERPLGANTPSDVTYYQMPKLTSWTQAEKLPWV